MPAVKRTTNLAPADRRAQIVAAAKKCMGQVGAKAFTMKHAADEAGVALSLVSYHFGNVEGLFNALVETVMLEEPPAKTLPAANLDDALLNLQALIDRHFDPSYYSRENLLVWLPVYEQTLLNEGVNERLNARDNRLIEEAVVLIGDVARNKGLNVDADQIAYDFLALLDGLWLAWCLSDREDIEQERQSAYRFLEAFLGPLTLESPA